MTLQLKAEVFNLDIECNTIMHSKHQHVLLGRYYHMVVLFKVSNHGPFQSFEADIPNISTQRQQIYYQNGNLAYILYKFTSNHLISFQTLLDQLDTFDIPSLKQVSYQNYRLDLKDFQVHPGFLQEMLYRHFHDEANPN